MSGTRTVVHLVRHGEVHNPDGILYGRRPGFGLSERGALMAAALGEYFDGADVTYLVASPLERAQQTAAPVADSTGLPIESDGRLIEADNSFEGQRWGVRDGILGRPANWVRLRNPFRPSWGEPYVDIAVRMSAAIEAARLAAYGHEAVCVGHQLPIWIAHSAAIGRRLWHDPRERICALASVTSLHFEGTELLDVGYVEPCGDIGEGVGA
ncbi:histidine phosphatase family protein [Epidermidibacterium keratini]|uniref:Histidine phosphatase family protein n=1 Tax=Epidermidibacterium keratini TaxID=1891644 RepID=A0A7L4YKP2_9ACTN|nr:histidine phosphatase family protein [Epidermidibacterium keratini]QHB99775.1 histidine phosphatase family protein [Epidermidibacterium keratini]